MSENNHPQQLMMLRRAAPIPVTPLKDGWTVRGMGEGEGAAWARICEGAGFFDSAEMGADERWQAAMGSDPGVKTENVFFACDPQGKPVATAAARLIVGDEREKYPPTAHGLGYLHFVAALPQSRGVGAGAAVTAAVLRRFEELGLPDCILTTDDFRLPAIKIYLNLGWLPVLNGPDMRERWERVLAQLGIAGKTAAVEANGEAAPPLAAQRP